MSEPTRSEDDIDGNVWERESRAMLAYAQTEQIAKLFADRAVDDFARCSRFAAESNARMAERAKG